jgi:hypothetical protein
MATITTILASDIIASSRVTLNTNFANLNTDKVDINSTYADPAWITSLAGSKITGNIGGNAATATALATARTIAGVSFNGTANIAIPSTGLSDSSDIVRGASSVASGQVLYGTGAGVAGSEAAFGYNAATDTLSVFNATINNTTPTTGVTQVIVRAGAGQSTTPVQQWQLSSGSARLLVTDTLGIQARGTFFAVQDSGGTINRAVVQSTMDVNSSYSFNFSSTTDATGTKDLSLSRASGNTLQVGDGGSNANGGLFASSIGVGVTPSIAANVNQVIIRAGSAQSTTNLTTWQNSSGTTLAAVLSTGTISAPGFTTASAIFNPSADMSVDAGTGFNVLLRPNNGVERVRVSGTFIRTTNSQLYQFSSDSTSFGTPDTGWSRNAAGVLEINNGTAGTFRDLFARGVRPVGSTVANLPTASGNTGMIATVTDATVTTIGTTVAGGGGNTVLVWSNGTNWRIYAN